MSEHTQTVNPPRIKKGGTYPIEIKKLVYQGWGLGDINGFKVFVPGTVPGDEVEIRIIKKKPRYAQGKCLRFIKKSPLKTSSPCQHSSDCGGCQLIDMNYDIQQKIKTEILNDCIQQFLPHLNDRCLPLIAAETNFYYRNKMEFAFAENETGIYLGLKRRGKFDEVIHTSECHLLSTRSNEIKKTIETHFNQQPLSTWDYHKHEGVLRHLMLRHSKQDDQYMLNFVVSEDIKGQLQPLIKTLTENFSEIVSILQSVQPSQSDTAFTPTSECLYGNSYIHETFGQTRFKISAQSFFQTNSKQGKVLYDTVLSTAQFKPSDLVLDLYCGTGTIGLYLAHQVKKVVGIEENPKAIEDAKENAQNNAVENIEFVCNRVKNVLKHTELKPDVIILDPPRSGTVPKALRRIIDLKCPQVIYVSCNPVTLMRDLIEFEAAGYEVERLQGVDMFPNTFHVEVVTKLILKG